MPLFSISPNVQKSETTSKKRTHEEFVDSSAQLAIDEPSGSDNLIQQKPFDIAAIPVDPHSHLYPMPIAVIGMTPGSSPVALTESGSSPASRMSPSPNKTPSQSPLPCDTIATQSSLPHSSVMEPVMQGKQQAKRKPISAEEQAQKRQKKEADAAEKTKKKAAEEATKAERAKKKEIEAAEKAQKKAAEEASRAAKAAEKAKKDAAKAAKKADDEAKKRKKDEEELAAKRKREKQQNMLASFIQRAPASQPKKPIDHFTNSSPKPKSRLATPQPEAETKAEPQQTAYERTFHPFFVKPGVTLASSPFNMDQETKDAKSGILDQYIRGERGNFNPRPFDPTKTFDIAFPQKRGITRPSVKKILGGVYDNLLEQASSATPARTESKNQKLVGSAKDQLNSLPMKYLSFFEDVRPPYFGTVSAPMEARALRKLSRRPAGKVLQLNYDYDSEAEWVEDDGEDLDDADDDDEEHEGDEEMDDFLDDSEDVATTVRPTFFGENEPSSTGICFEDPIRHGPCASIYKYRLEFLHDKLENHSGIDPFSTSYWPSTPKKVVAKTAATAVAKATILPIPFMPSSMPPPNTPAGTFSSLISGTAGTGPAVDPKTLIPEKLFDDFKQAVVSEELRGYTKATLVDLLAKQFPLCTKAQIKATLDRVAHRVTGPHAPKSLKQWTLLPGFAS
ncbi:chromatin assembly factor 1 subunit A-domain-containing protein [Hypoxylon sp. NC1633]|nr:chromatin assembly factor 1 subunit A-domain-containing protein [Hypoxylon sp. NC1633]